MLYLEKSVGVFLLVDEYQNRAEVDVIPDHLNTANMCLVKCQVSPPVV